MLSCHSRRETKLPPVEGLALSYRFQNGFSRRYHLRMSVESAATGPVLSGRNFSLRWQQKVTAVKKDGTALIANRIEDVVFESAPSESSRRGLDAVIQNALRGITLTFFVSPRGVVMEGRGPDIDWEKGLQPFFEERGFAPRQCKFVVELAEMNFSSEQILPIVTLPFIALPPERLGEGSEWQEERRLAICGIGAEATTVYRIAGFEHLESGQKALEILMESGRLGGRAILDLPTTEAPVVMQVDIAEGTGKGRALVDPGDASLLEMRQIFNITVETKAGLPSLQPGEGIGGSAAAVKMALSVSMNLNRIL